MDKSNQKCRVAPLHDNHSDVQLIAGCGVGGIKAARLATGLETGTGEPVSKVKFFITNIKVRNGRTNCRIPLMKVHFATGADALVVALIAFESWQ